MLAREHGLGLGGVFGRNAHATAVVPDADI